MALNWVTEPSDFTGTVGDTMPVVAQVGGGESSGGCPIGETWGNYGVGYDPYDLQDFTWDDRYITPVVNGDGSISTTGTSSVPLTHLLSTSGEFEIATEWTCYPKYYIPWSCRVHFSDSTWVSMVPLDGKLKLWLPSRDEIIVDIPSHWAIWDTHIARGEVAFKDGVLSARFTVTHVSTGESVSIEDEVVAYAGVTDIVKIVYMQALNSARILRSELVAKQGLPNDCTGETFDYNLTLKDNTGTTRDTQVSTDGNYSHDVPSMQESDNGTWTLEAENAGDIISSVFAVNVKSLYWITEPSAYSGAVGDTMPVVAQVGGNNLDLNDIAPYALTGATESHTADSITVTSLQTGYTSAISQTFANADFDCNFDMGGVLGSPEPGIVAQAVWLESPTVGGASTISIYPRSDNPYGVFVDIGGNYRIISEISLYSPFKVYISKIGSTVTIILVQGESSGIFSADVDNTGAEYEIRFYSAGTTGVLEVTNFLLISGVAFNLLDPEGVSRNTQVSTDVNYNYNVPNMQESSTGNWVLLAEFNGETITSHFSVLITTLSWVDTPVNPNVVNLGENITITASVNSSNVDWILTRNGATVDSRIGGSSSYSFTKISELIDNSTNWVLNATVGSQSINYTFTVKVISEAVKERGEYRYLLELSEKINWEPSLATSANIENNSENRIISVIALGEPSTPNYWTEWGGGYDNPEQGQIELFFNQFLVRVDSLEALLKSGMAYVIIDDTCYFTTDLYAWQYFRKLSSARSSYGFSTTVRDPLNPSDDEYDGIRYPVRLDIPKVTNVEVPDPINGVILSGTFSVTLDNEDGYFDSVAGVTLFNSPVTLKKTDVLLPSLSDFDIIRTGLIEDQSIDFIDYRINSADVFRTLTEPACRTVSENVFPLAGKSIGKKMPLAWGYIENASLISVVEEGVEFIVCDPEYMVSVESVFDGDGNSLSFTEENGIISSTEDAKTCTFYGLSSNRIGEIIVSEVSEKANIPFVEGVWDIEEVNRYISTSSTVGLLFDGDTVKKLVEECTESDSAFFMTKNSGLVTIRRWGDQYDSHTNENWLITRDPEKEYSEQKYFASSISVGYSHDYESGESSQFFLLDQYESDVSDIYSKTQRLTFETKIDNEVQAGSLAQRLFRRLSRRSEIVRLYTGGNTSKINIADTVLAPIDVNGRSISEFKTWLVRAVDPAQDILVLEQKFGEVQGVSGILSEPTNEIQSGFMSHVTNQNESGELSQPFAIVEG